MRRALLVAGVVVAVVLTVATPALADPARPTNYRSEVTGIDPASDSVHVRVLGGDAFLGMEVDRGTEAMVFGYAGEPYLRVDTSGVVWANIHSPAYYLNNNRYARVTVPPSASADAAPEWKKVGGGGRYGWHDHRIHWMSPQPPPGVIQNLYTEIQQWTVPIEVDGIPTTVSGDLVWLPAISPFPWLLVLLAVLGLLLLAERRFDFAAAIGLALGSILALVVGGGQVASSPFGIGGELLAWAPPSIGLVLGIWAATRRDSEVIALALGAVLLGTWVVLRVATLWMPVLPSDLPSWLERTGVAVAAATSIAAVLQVFSRYRPVTGE